MSKYDVPAGMKREFKKFSGSKQACDLFLDEYKRQGWKKSHAKKVIGCYLVVVYRLVPETN